MQGNIMASEREVLAARNGVELEQVTLRDGNDVVAVAFVVKSRRTPEVPNFGDIIPAQQYFNEEVQRCARAGAGRVERGV
jgi:hypothetical protein